MNNINVLCTLILEVKSFSNKNYDFGNISQIFWQKKKSFVNTWNEFVVTKLFFKSKEKSVDCVFYIYCYISNPRIFHFLSFSTSNAFYICIENIGAGSWEKKLFFMESTTNSFEMDMIYIYLMYLCFHKIFLISSFNKLFRLI